VTRDRENARSFDRHHEKTYMVKTKRGRRKRGAKRQQVSKQMAE
jgi:hypothetical protein